MTNFKKNKEMNDRLKMQIKELSGNEWIGQKQIIKELTEKWPIVFLIFELSA